MTEESPPITRVATGIPGLDPILEGGLLKGGVYILQGPPGAGKTIFANQVAFHHATSGHQAVYATLLSESHTRMLAHLRRMSFFNPKLIPERLYYVSGFKVLEADGLEGLLKTLRQAVTSRGASLLVLDGLVSAEESSPSPRDFKKLIHELQSVCAMTDCTAILLGSTERQQQFNPAHTMVDGILELSDELSRLTSLRHLQVRKLRGAAQVRGRHSFSITNAGIAVTPRLETQIKLAAAEGGPAPQEATRLGFGIEKLDEMLRGGLPSQSMTMILGPTGVGKTMLGLAFLAEGARRGEPGLHFGFYERPPAILEKAERVKLGLTEAYKKGLVELLWQSPVENVIDILGARLFDTVRRMNARRVFIDSIQCFELAVDDVPERIRGVFAALAEELERLGVTTVYSVETQDVLGPIIKVPATGISQATQNILLLRHAEVGSEVHQLLSVLKVRDSDFDRSIRKFVVTSSGIALADLSPATHSPTLTQGS